MTYEVIHGEQTHFLQAGNPYQACLEALRIEAEENDIQQAPFDVTPLPEGESENIPMALIIGLQLAANGEEFEPPTMDLSCW